MENILYKMTSTKILKINEFKAINKNIVSNIHVQEVTGVKIAATQTEPLYESESFTSAMKIENNYIVLPFNPKCKITIESLTLNLTNYIQSQRIGESGFSVGHYFTNDYKSGESIWNEKSLCVSLVGEISDRAGTIATAVEIMRMYNLPRILILTETCMMEITRDGNQVKPLPQHRIKRIGE